MGAADVQAYLSYLDTKQAAVAGTVSAAEITHQYSVVFNGFSALLTDDEVRALKKNSGVASISADSILQLDTSYTPSFLGLDKPGGLWEQLGGKAHAGEDIIIGIVDSGIWPENTAFADRLDENGVPSHNGNNVVYGAPPASWQGTCQTGEGFSAENCNNKLIGARYYRAATSALHWTEFFSPRDSVAGLTGHGGHGTHTASTAGGNNGALATSNGVSLGKASGMAPRARIAAYKVCWTAASTGAQRLRHGRQRGRHRPGGQGWRQRHQLLHRPERGRRRLRRADGSRLPRRGGGRRVRRHVGRQFRPGHAGARRAGARVAHQPVAGDGGQFHPQPPVRGQCHPQQRQQAGRRIEQCEDAGRCR